MTTRDGDDMKYPLEQTCDHDYRCTNPEHPRDEDGDCPLPVDDGTMQENVNELADAVVGHCIVSAEQRDAKGGYGTGPHELVLTLDNGTQVSLQDAYDCCAGTDLESFLLHPDQVDHIIMGVGTTDGFQTWHIYADFGDVMELKVQWSAGNPFYYAYGFNISVKPLQEATK